MRQRAKFAAFIAYSAALSACSLLVSVDGLSGGSAGDSGIPADGAVDRSPLDGGVADGSGGDSSLGVDSAFLDDFNRPDAEVLGNNWIEKRSIAFSLTDEAVLRGIADSFDYPDNMVYRPPSEDIEDSTISVELTFASTVVGYPQIHSRIQQDSIGSVGIVDSYLFYISVGSPTFAILARTRGAENLANLQNVSLTDTLAAGERYRLTMQISGKNPVSLLGTVEHFVSGSWAMIGQGAAIDSDPSRLDDAGSTGFSCSTNDSDRYTYDNFTRTSP